MHESAGELNEALVKKSVRQRASSQPKLLQHVMRVVEKLPVKTLQIPKVMGFQNLPVNPLYKKCNFSAFLPHPYSLKPKAPGQKPKVSRPTPPVLPNT